jgi:hypothetical protein
LPQIIYLQLKVHQFSLALSNMFFTAAALSQLE